MMPSKDIARLIEIMAALRDPKTGCPWDIEQSFATIAPYTVEEAYEVSDAIERDDMVDLREELGDLLLQVAYHAQLAAEQGLFDFGDVVETITRKMIRRHPHVFGDAVARSARSAKGQWERIKAEEKAERAALRAKLAGDANPANTANGADRPRHLDEIPAALPALTLALKVQKKAADTGFDWDRPEPILEKIDEELAEFAEAIASRDRDASEAELGDLLFSVVNLARFHEIDPELALRRCVRKFRERFGYIEDQLDTSNRSLHSASLDEMEALWVAAKRRSAPSPD
ncbi:nucleoside triphosphate pyrophosphohydrolase [Aurantimonas marianensis]|uniref:Nucleoside triphosphate pyrophosphohydrolase n=1 Tax=Aurantimonas marianensis TaxID=2920428 RepID=A0A9X2H594_9HYPH|nr:nucleoside triphosphate pyrophosphohydrolase [Aurantimonas marianensis]MCP3054466.1 nucleoside triphosphate pyrophosphohydrolase [Aurantimonas marianensis]